MLTCPTSDDILYVRCGASKDAAGLEARGVAVNTNQPIIKAGEVQCLYPHSLLSSHMGKNGLPGIDVR